MRLLGGTPAHQRGPVRRRDLPGGPDFGSCPRGEPAARLHLALDQRTEAIMIDVAGHRDHEVWRSIQPPVEAVDLVPRDGGDRLLRSQDGPAERMSRPE